MPTVNVSLDRGVARIEMDRPPLNVIDLASAPELTRAITATAARDDVAVIALAARGKAFCAGVDVRDHLPDRGAEMLAAFHRVCIALLEAPQPTLAIVQGAALGGGCELTLCCDMVLAAEVASFGQPEIRLGVFPPVAAVALPRMVPSHLACELLLTGRILSAAEAERAGLVNRVVEAGALEGAVDGLLATLRALSPASLRQTKALLRRLHARPSALEIDEAERYYVEYLLQAPDAIEGLTAFIEKRAPVWGGAARPA